MCGRFVGSFTIADVVRELGEAAASAGLGVPDADERTLIDDYNVAPTRLVPVVKISGRSVEVEAMRWGLVPTWAKETPKGQVLVNARSETVHEKPTFRNLWRGHRCVVPMNGFYEWDRSHDRKTPYFVPRADGRLLWCLALWSRPAVMDGLATCAVLTRASAPDLAWIHDRAPVHTDPSTAVEWLTDDDHPLRLIESPPPLLAPRRVSVDVNSVRHNGAHLVEPVGDDPASRSESSGADGPLFD